ncbi:MAG: hypothetical protein ACOYT9_00700, partial [Patescibacteria group bacterium]
MQKPLSTKLLILTLIIVTGVGGYYLGSRNTAVPTVLTPTPTIVIATPPELPIELLPTGTPTTTTSPVTWKKFTSKNWSFYYPSDAKVNATSRYLSGECYDDKNIYVGCGTLDIDYKELHLEDSPCSECSPGYNGYYMTNGKAVLVYGNLEEGVLRTVINESPTPEKKQVTIAYTGFKRGTASPIGVVTMLAPKADFGQYYVVADKLAISILTNGKEITTLPAPSYYPIAYSTAGEVQIIDNNGKLIQEIPTALAKLNGNGRFAALSPTQYYDLVNKTYIVIEDSARYFQDETDYYDMDLSVWTSDTEFMV